ncbi:MAG: hypothetical protein QW270_03070 [Candidatus Bathyarchaeia archaeon]
MSKPQWFICPFKRLKPSEISPTYDEPPLKVRGYAITYLWAFDVGASNLRVRVKPKDVVEELLSLGYAVAYTAYTEELEGVGIAVKSSFEGLQEKAEQEFAKQTELLDAFGWWDNIQVPVYVRLGRLARAIFPQIKIKLPYDEDFRTASVVASVYVGGAACLSLHLTPKKVEKGLTTDETLNLFEDFDKIGVEVIFPEQLRGLIQNATNLQNAGYGIFGESWRKIRDMRYRATLADVMHLFTFAVHSAVLETLNWRKNPENYRRISEAQAQEYYLIYLLAGDKPVENPFQEVVKKHPRQCLGLLICDRCYKMRSAEYVSNYLVDISPSVGVSGFFSQNTMLRICSDDFWDEAFGVLDAVPTHGIVIADVACFGLLNCLLILHLAYDLLLTRVLSEGVKELVEAENRVVAGLEEIYEARHQIFGSVSDWWWLAEEKLGISELNKAVNEKLSRIHTMITTKTEQKTNTRLTTLTVITAILTALTIIPIIEKYVLPILPPLPPAPANTLPLALAISISITSIAIAVYIASYTATMFLKILAKIPIPPKIKTKLAKTTLKLFQKV